ncbi:hypothetical protein [Allofournierella sp.]|uniref:hypothetical protein n=1 Tax=Allofournierella sp. TaxID=1940256 RepID=UPI002E792647|nr:hypothetical protein [Fournierella sp.]MEE0755767.1 hypothetical protein [Fournierella sp.]
MEGWPAPSSFSSQGGRGRFSRFGRARQRAGFAAAEARRAGLFAGDEWFGANRLTASLR